MRDLMSVRVWDLAMSREPVRVIDVADSLRPRLSELWETEKIFDRFEIAVVRNPSSLQTRSLLLVLLPLRRRLLVALLVALS